MRKELTIVIDDEGRDHGKVFLIKEMSASQAERWAMRVLLSVAKSGIEIPDHVEDSGMAGIAAIGFKAFASIPFQELDPLMAEMMECIIAVPDPSKRNMTRPLIEDDIEEVKTRIKLKAEVFKLHTGFSTGGAS